MIVVNARFEVDDGVIDTMRDALTAMERASRAEAGCIDYAFSVETGNRNALRITECWESEAILAAHFETPHMKEFLAAIGGIERRNPDVHFWEVKEVSRPGG